MRLWNSLDAIVAATGTGSPLGQRVAALRVHLAKNPAERGNHLLAGNALAPRVNGAECLMRCCHQRGWLSARSATLEPQAPAALIDVRLLSAGLNFARPWRGSGRSFPPPIKISGQAQPSTVRNDASTLPQGDGDARPAFAGGTVGGEHNLMVLNAGNMLNDVFAVRGPSIDAEAEMRSRLHRDCSLL